MKWNFNRFQTAFLEFLEDWVDLWHALAFCAVVFLGGVFLFGQGTLLTPVIGLEHQRILGPVRTDPGHDAELELVNGAVFQSFHLVVIDAETGLGGIAPVGPGIRFEGVVHEDTFALQRFESISARIAQIGLSAEKTVWIIEADDPFTFQGRFLGVDLCEIPPCRVVTMSAFTSRLAQLP